MGSWIENGFEKIVADMVGQLLQFALNIVQACTFTPFNLNYLPGFTMLEGWIIAAAFAWLVVAVLKELFMNQFEGLGGQEVNPLYIFKNMIMSGVLIKLSPLIVTAIILPITSFIGGAVTASIGNPITLTHDLSHDFNLSAGTATGGLLLIIDPEAGFFVLAAIAVGLIITCLYVGISSGLRWMELIFLALAGPALAVQKVSYGTAWDGWLRETVAVALSQVIQYFSLTLGMDILVNPDSVVKMNGTTVVPYVYLFLALGAFIFAFRGPKTLRNILGAQPNGLRGMSSVASTAAMAIK